MPSALGETPSFEAVRPRRLSWLLLPLSIITALEIVALLKPFATAGALGETRHVAWVVTFTAWAIAGQGIVLWRVWLAARYRPMPSVSDDQLPGVTVVVPAFNEGRQVYETLRSLVQSDYPRDRLHIVAVDDGSADDTWSWMALARSRFGRVVTAVHCRQNRGKREALCEGFRRAKGEVIVTVDSDSEVRPDTIRNLVTPIVRDARVGAVAGNVRVLNDNGAFGRMLDVSFTCAFDLMRAAESELDMVTCCPGALSAYRRELVDRFTEEWRTMTFLGRPATIGEDRAMTNLVLRAGKIVKFQSNAVVFTEVPTTWKKLSRMLLRWRRSNVRESLRLGRFIFTNFREGQVWGPRIAYAWSSATLLIGGVLFAPSIVALALHPRLLPWYFAGALWSAAFPATVFALTRAPVLRSVWAFPYSLYSTLCLSWIGPWGMLTPHRSSWMTRGLPRPAPAFAAANSDLVPSTSGAMRLGSSGSSSAA